MIKYLSEYITEENYLKEIVLKENYSNNIEQIFRMQ